MGTWYIPFGVPQQPPSTHLKNQSLFTKDAWGNFDKTGKKSFHILKNEVRNQKLRILPPITENYNVEIHLVQ